MEHVSSRARLTTLLSAVTIGFILRQLLRSPPSKLIVDPSKVGRQLGDGFDVDEYDVIIVGGGAHKSAYELNFANVSLIF